ncbi:glycoprotein Xg isoform X4 [Sciurus carolinensis]|uniref:glycoprotein Xg isoform X4 n=1 Tax=Sciurus carolinensis TaxID=30640 RepID=UPI001FB44240|nr:glycoprotein Xg isoform X4 [Sciurus carolinensis]
METRRGLPWILLLLCALTRARAQRDFDLSDALDDPEPTKKPSSDIYPKPRPPYGPQPGTSDHGSNIYPRPKPQPHPQPGNSDHGGGGGGGSTSGGGGGGYSSYGDADGGDGQSTYGNPQGNTVARIVSPIVSVVVVTLVGAGVSYFKSNRRRNCFRASEPETV